MSERRPVRDRRCAGSRGQRALRAVGSVLLAVLFLAMLLSRVALEDIAALAGGLRPGWAVVAVGLYSVMSLARGVRFWVMTKRAVSPVRLGAISAAQVLLLRLLPLRTGEISFVGLLGREPGVGTAWASKILVAVRLLDLATISVVFIVAVSLSGVVPHAVRATVPVAAVTMVLPLALLAFPAQVASAARRPIRWLTGTRVLSRVPGVGKLDDLLDRMTAISDPQWFRRSLPGLVLVSAAVWAAGIGVSYACLRALGVRTPFVDASYVSSVLVLSSVLPIHGIGGYGPQNAIGAGLLMTVGIAQETAITAHIAWHTMQHIISAVVGAVGWLITTATEPRGFDETSRATDADGGEE